VDGQILLCKVFFKYQVQGQIQVQAQKSIANLKPETTHQPV
jgi:hypothetical protein